MAARRVAAVVMAALVSSSSRQRVGARCKRLHHLMAETLTEAIQDEQQQRGRNQTDQDHAQPQLTNHQQVNSQRQGAEVHLYTDTVTLSGPQTHPPAPTAADCWSRTDQTQRPQQAAGEAA